MIPPSGGWIRQHPYRAAGWALICVNLLFTVDLVVFSLRPDLYREPVVGPGEVSVPTPDPSREPDEVRGRTPSVEPVPERFRRLFGGSVFTAAGAGANRDGSPRPSDRDEAKHPGSSPGTSDPENTKLDVMGWVSDTTSVRVLVRDRGRGRTYSLGPGDTVPGRGLRLESATGTAARFRRSDGGVVERSLPSAATREDEIRRMP